MKSKWIISPGILLTLLILMIVSPSAGSNPTYDPNTGRTYDPFGSFFDEYGQYVDVVNNMVVDKYGKTVRNAYFINSDTYMDSTGQIYGARKLAGQLEEGSWFFKNGYYRDSSTRIFERNFDGSINYEYTNENQIPFIITINTLKRIYLGREESQIAWNLKNNLMDPKTQRNIYAFEGADYGAEDDVARFFLQEGYIDDDGFLTFFIGTISNPDPERCKAWSAGIKGVSLFNGKRLKFNDWNCYSCTKFDGSEDVASDGCIAFQDQSVMTPNIEDWNNLQFQEFPLEADWLGDGQDIFDDEKQQPTGQVIGANPYNNFIP